MKVAVVGSYGAGLTMRIPQIPGPGETLTGGEFSEGPGGKGSNQAVAAARLGADVQLLTALGNDGFGETARALWQQERIDATHVLMSERPTMVGFIWVEPSGENRITIAPGALEELDEAAVRSFADAIDAADILIVSMEIPEPAVVEALRLGRSHGTRTLLNPAPARELPAGSWRDIDILTPNQSEAPVLLGLKPDHGLDDVELVRRLHGQTQGDVILTRGDKGALVCSSRGIEEIPPVRASSVMDTTGAGDAFTAALAVAVAEGASVSNAARFAATAGAHAVSIAGVIPALPTRDLISDLQSKSRPESAQNE